MASFKQIEGKLQAFIKKYYTNELIKGSILFLSFGLLYFIFTLFIESFFWLKPIPRTILFYTFILIELLLLITYILIPISKLIGINSGITKTKASLIIGKHFSDVEDKLLNVLQLNETSNKSDLLIASIEQKATQLSPIPFKKAINFGSNKKYAKYLLIPIMIWLVTFLTGNENLINDSLTRIVHHQTYFTPPAPFSIHLQNKNLKVIEGKPFVLKVETIGNTIPENVKINYNNQSYYLKEESKGLFTYTFNDLKQNINFNFQANQVESKTYQLNVINAPSITKFDMYANYPNYTQKKNETIANTGNAIIPEGTVISWKLKTNNTSNVQFITKNNLSTNFAKKADEFSFHKKLRNTLNYSVNTSNNALKNYEVLPYTIQVIKDEYPKMMIKTDLDSITRGMVQFVGQISDDYGISSLKLIYYDDKNTQNKQEKNIPIKTDSFQEFFYVFSPEDESLHLQKGINYSMYFELFDNDGVNGAKSVKSKIFSYRNKTDNEVQEQILREQKQNVDDLNNTSKKTEKLNEALEDFSNKIKNQKQMNWQDNKELNQFIKRQEKYQQMLEKNTNKLQQNLDELKKEKNPLLNEKKEDLKKRLEEMKKLQKKEKLLDELKKLAEKLDKENFLKKLDKLTKKNKQDEKSLERILELTKRYYAQKKSEEIANKLNKLSKEQKKLEKSEENTSKKQEGLNKKFDEIKKDFKQLDSLNKALKKPMKMPKAKEEKQSIEKDMKDAKEKLEEEQQDKQEEGEQPKSEEQNQKQQAKKKQKSAAKKMKQLSQKMQASMMAMEGEMLDEDIDNLRAIVENLIKFSLDQEEVLLAFKTMNNSSPDFSKKLKHQQMLKEYFEHIDDSIYSLSLRMPKMSETIQKDITDAHYNIDQSLGNIAENKINQAVMNQQFTMTAANNLASFLSDLLDASQNPSMGMGSGKGKGQPSMSLPDIIKKQSEMMSKMKQKGNNKGEGKQGKKGESGEDGKNGKEKGKQGNGSNGEQMSGKMYEIYKQQNALKNALKDLLSKQGGTNGSKGNKALKQMEDLEKMLLNKGITNASIQKIQQIKYELLKLEKATFKQGQDNKRKSNTNKKEFKKKNIPSIPSKKLFFNPNEILNRNHLPLQTIYKKKVQEYFKQKATTND